MSLSTKFLGVEIGGTKLQLSVMNLSGDIEQSFRYTIDPSRGASNIREQLSMGIKKLEDFDDVVTTGVGFGGPVNWNTGTICLSHQISGWEDFDLCSWLQVLTKKPAVIENDANVAALAEATLGCGKGYERIFYMTVGSGIGGGFILNGEIYHGSSPGEVEVGHLRLDKTGCTLESRCSGWAVNKRVRDYIQNNPGSILSKLSLKSSFPEATLLKPALEEDDEIAKQIIEEISDDFAFALSHVVHLFHPDIIVIGGGLSLLKDHLRIPVQQKLSNYVMKAFLPVPSVKIAALEENVVPAGAAELAKKKWMEFSKLNFSKPL